jgi:hypothetical protein
MDGIDHAWASQLKEQADVVAELTNEYRPLSSPSSDLNPPRDIQRNRVTVLKTKVSAAMVNENNMRSVGFSAISLTENLAEGEEHDCLCDGNRKSALSDDHKGPGGHEARKAEAYISMMLMTILKHFPWNPRCSRGRKRPGLHRCFLRKRTEADRI